VLRRMLRTREMMEKK